MLDRPIIFFDGVCVLCNRFADFILKRDKKNFFYLSTLQGEHAKKMLSPEHYENFNTIVYLKGEKTYNRSDAVLNILLDLGGLWNVCFVLFVFPKPIRDLIYRHISNKRYKWFGKKEHCRIPLPDEKDKFLA